MIHWLTRKTNRLSGLDGWISTSSEGSFAVRDGRSLHATEQE